MEKIKNYIDFLNYYFNDTDYFFIGINNHRNSREFKDYKHNLESLLINYEKLDYHNKTKSLYFTFNPFKGNLKTDLNKFKINVKNIKSIVFDFDNEDTSKTDLQRLLKDFPNYTYILKTSPKKYQVLFMFENPLNIENMEEFELIHKTLSKHYGSDKNVCSIEKYMRLPTTRNGKNGFYTQIDFKENKTDYLDFKNFVNENCLDILEDLKNKKNKKEGKKEKILKSVPTKINNEKEFIFEEFELNEEHLKKYISINNRLKDCSKTDIIYIKERRKKENDFNTIFNEILLIRKEINSPLKRDLTHYFNDRYKIFLS